MAGDPGRGDERFEDAVLIAGPTASGKSRLAMRIAERSGGTIVNADSMQVYSTLRVLTARPSTADEVAVPHRLFGHVSPSIAYSVAQFIRDVETMEPGPRPYIFVGGTGLYFRALTGGLSAMPDIPGAIRSRWRDALLSDGAEALHARLAARDARAAAVLRPRDGQRIVRALEVLDASGRSILDWQGDRTPPLIAGSGVGRIVLAPDREVLRSGIDSRFDSMLADGALGEVSNLAAMQLPQSLPAMKAIGVRELASVLRGKLTVKAAAEAVKVQTRQYAKRQETFFRNQFGAEWVRSPTWLDARRCNPWSISSFRSRAR